MALPDTRPNILMIFTDQHRSHALSCYGDENIDTPNLDRLAKEGVRFTRAYSSCPLCSPFRASLYTGQYIHEHGVISIDYPMVRTQNKVLPEILQDNGYYTSHMGKWHLSGGAAPTAYVSEYFRPGWNDWLGWEMSNRPFKTYYCTGEERNKKYLLKGYQANRIIDLTLEWIDSQKKDRPWFHVISLEAPHFPNIAPKKYMRIFRFKKLKLRPNVPTSFSKNKEFMQKLRGYYAQIKNLDDNVGRVIKKLEDNGQFDNTIIFYFADHGDLMGSHGRINKSRPEEESVSIPLIIRYPRQIPKGLVSDALISNVDFAPTLLGLLGIAVPAYIQGRDLSNTLFSKPSNGNESVLIQYEHTFFKEDPDEVFRTIITNKWKYTYFLTMGPAMLFDLEADPYELRNLIDNEKYDAVKKDMHDLLIDKLKEVKDMGILKRMGYNMQIEK